MGKTDWPSRATSFWHVFSLVSLWEWKDTDVSRELPRKIAVPWTRKMQKTRVSQSCTKSARQRFWTPDISYLECQSNHLATWNLTTIISISTYRISSFLCFSLITTEHSSQNRRKWLSSKRAFRRYPLCQGSNGQQQYVLPHHTQPTWPWPLPLWMSS